MAELEASRCVWWTEKHVFVNKQKSDTLFYLILHLEAKLHLLPQRWHTVGKHKDVCFLQEANVSAHNYFESHQFSHPHYL